MTQMDEAGLAAQRVTFEDTPDRLKVTIPLRRNRLFLTIYTILVIVWLAGTIYTISFTLAQFDSDIPTQFLFLWSVMVFVMLLVWVWFGRRFLWRWWQYYLATREILFIDKETLIVRRPVSILGLTDAYDMRHVSPFYYHDKHEALAFDYGRRGVLLAPTLPRADSVWLLVKLNDRFFPGWNDEDDDDE